jgi:hypothetical protein
MRPLHFFIPSLAMSISYLSYLLALTGVALKGSPFLVFSLLLCEWLTTLRLLDFTTKGYWKRFFGLWFILSPVLLLPLSVIVTKALIFHELQIISIFLGFILSFFIIFLLSFYRVKVIVLTIMSVLLFVFSIMLNSEILMCSSSITSIFAGVFFINELIVFVDTRQITK